MNEERNINICKRCPYASYRDERVVFCGVCMRKILDEMQREKAERQEKEKEDSGDGRKTQNQ